MRQIGKPRIDIDGPAAPPRRNGELVFQEPWEGRAFGLAVALRDLDLFQWEAFRRKLIAAVAVADRAPEGESRPGYYENWLAALQNLLVESGLISTSEVDHRAQEFATGERDITDPGGRRTSGTAG